MAQVIDRPQSADTTINDAVAAARALAPLLFERAAETERARRLPPDVVAAIIESGLHRLTVDPVDGGSDISLPDIMRVLETLAYGDASAAWCTWATLGLPAMSAFMTVEAAAAILRPRLSLSASTVNAPGRAIPVEGGYRVTARWPFMSNAPQAHWFGGPCLVVDGDQPRMGPDGQPLVIFPLVPRAETRMIETWDTTGLRGTGTNDIEVTDVFVSDAFTADFTRTPRPGMNAVHLINVDLAANVTAAVMSLGIARRAIDTVVELGHRKTLKQGGLLAESPLAQLSVGEARTRLGQASAYLYGTVEAMWDVVRAGGLPGDEWLPETSLAATSTVDAAIEVTGSMYRVAATSAVFASSPLDRCLRDVYTLGAHIMVQRQNYLVYGPQQFGSQER
jgi:alkylation response protein AidB-like acyl-CoA dehydrogenase